MERNKSKTLPHSKSVKELVDFFETHDMGDYWEQMPEVCFDVNIEKRKHLVALEEDVVDKLTKIAKSKKVSSESLINTWLKDRIRKATKIQKVA
ncbi:MAG: CopG family antitoxin [bacterium]